MVRASIAAAAISPGRFGRIEIRLRAAWAVARTCGLILGLTAAARGAESSAAVQAMQLAREAATAVEAKDFDAAVEKLTTAVGLRRDFPTLYLDLAVAQAGAGRLEEAVAMLRDYAAFGLFASVEKAPEFAPLKSRQDFQDVVKKISGHQVAKGSGEIAFSLRGVTGLIEGIAWREKTGTFLFGDVHARAIWERKKDGSLVRLTPEGETLFGAYGLAIDENAGTLWAATSAVPAMLGFTADQAGQAALAEIDLDTGTVRRVLPVPRAAGSEAAHVLTDIAVGPDGSVYITDEATPLVWRLAPGAPALERWLESPDFLSLQGLAVLPSGALLIADQVNGLVGVDPVRRQTRWLEPPVGVTLGDIKSLTLAPDGEILALQSGTRPNRVLRIEVDANAESIAAVTVLESGHLAMGAPSQGCIDGAGDFYFVGHAGWSRFAGGDGQPTAPRQVPIFRTKLPKKKK